MNDDLKDLRRDLDEMIERQLLHRHESIMRDDTLFRRGERQEYRIETHSASLKKTLDLMDALTHRVTETVGAVNALTVKVDKLIGRMDQTDERWNELITLFSKEHGNGA